MINDQWNMSEENKKILYFGVFSLQIKLCLQTWKGSNPRPLYHEFTLLQCFNHCPQMNKFLSQFAFCLAKDQGITWVVVVVDEVLHHLFHFLFRKKLKWKNLLYWESNRGTSDPQPSTYSLSYRAIDNIVKFDFYMLPQTLDQYWSSLFFILAQGGRGSKQEIADRE